MKEYLVTLAHYNLWANRRIISVMPNDEALFDAEAASSFTSLRKTLLHIWDAQLIWLYRLQDKQIAKVPSEIFEGSVTELCNALLAQSEEFYLFLDAQLPTYPEKSIHYSTLKGDPFVSSAQDVVSHCMNHSTFHRGQLITQLHQLGIHELISTDMITYYRTMKEVKKDILD